MSGYNPEWSPNTSVAEGTDTATGTQRHRENVRPDTLLSDLGEAYEALGHDRQPEAERIGVGSDEKYLLVFGDVSFSIISLLTQRVLAHPCIVFRNQCQLNNRMDSGYKLTPWSVVRPMHNIYRNQGIMALWKGIYNDFIISSLRKCTEMFVSENTSLPLSLDEPARGNIVNTYSKHVLLKTISCLVTTPLICAGYTLRVQSQVVVGDTSYFAVLFEAYHRLTSSLYSHNSETSHLLPLYSLVFPIVILDLGSYLIHGMSHAAVRKQYQLNSIQLEDTDHDEIPLIKTMYDRYYPRLLSAFSGCLLSDICFYPLATVTGRLILQGTRTIIDDAETGNAVLPFTSTYSGVVDCFKCIAREEGFLGLYKGFGSLIMQYTVQALILRGTHLLYERIMETHYPRVPRRSLYTPATPSSTYSSVTSLNTKT